MVCTRMQDPVGFKSMMYQQSRIRMIAKFEYSLQLLCVLFLSLFLLQKQLETCPKDMQVSTHTGIIFYNNNRSVFYHLIRLLGVLTGEIFRFYYLGTLKYLG